MIHPSRRLAGLAAAAMIGVIAFRRGEAQPRIESDAQARSLVADLVARSAATQDALKRRADEQLDAAVRRRNAVIAENRRLLRRADVDAAERRRLDQENARLQQERAEVIAQLEASDTTFKTAVDDLRKHISVLLEDPSPQRRDALDRYAAGDVAALDDLQGLVRADRQAREDAFVAEARIRARLKNADEQRGVARLVLDAKDKGERSTAQAIDAWKEAAGLDDGDAWTWIHLAELYQETGQLRDARAAGERAVSTAKDDRDRAAALNASGNVLVETGDLGAARTRFEESLRIAQRLAAADPGSTSARRDVCVMLNRIGDILVDMGDLAGGRARYEESLAIEEQLASANSNDEESQRLEAITLANLGRLLVRTGDASGARAGYERSLAIAKRLAAAHPASADAQRAVSVALTRVGDILLATDQPGAAYDYYTESLSIRRRLAAMNPASAAAQRDILVTLLKLGDVQVESTLLRGARTQFEEALTLARRLAAENPTSAQARRDVSVSVGRLGDVLLSMGDVAQARASFEEYLAISRQLAAADPISAQAQRDVLVSYVKLAGLPGGDRYWGEALKIAEDMERTGRLAPRDRPLLKEIRRRAVPRR